MRKYRLLFSPLALNDVAEATGWYNLQQKGLGKRFKADVKATLISIANNPFFASVKYDNIRTAACQVFPYAIHYEVDENANVVRVLAIFHFSRKPFWLKED